MAQQNSKITDPVSLAILGFGVAFSLAASNPSNFSSLVKPVSYCETATEMPSFLFAKHMETIKQRINSFRTLSEGWDGYGGSAPENAAIENTLAFLDILPQNFVFLLTEDSLVPTPYGTITMEWNKTNDKFVSVEIGVDQLAYFYEIEDVQGESDENIPFGAPQSSEEVVAALNNLYNATAS